MAPGRCFRLWSEAEQARKADFDPPECFRVDLAGACLLYTSQAITRSIADQARTIRIPVHMIETINKLMRVQKQLVQELSLIHISSMAFRARIREARDSPREESTALRRFGRASVHLSMPS